MSRSFDSRATLITFTTPLGAACSALGFLLCRLTPVHLVALCLVGFDANAASLRTLKLIGEAATVNATAADTGTVVRHGSLAIAGTEQHEDRRMSLENVVALLGTQRRHVSRHGAVTS